MACRPMQSSSKVAIATKFNSEDLSYLKKVLKLYHAPVGLSSSASSSWQLMKDEATTSSTKLRKQGNIMSWMQTLNSFEDELIKQVHSKRENVTETIEKGAFQLNLTLSMYPQSHEYSLVIDSITPRFKSTPIAIFLDRYCGKDYHSSLYLVKVKIKDVQHSVKYQHILRDIGDNGLYCFDTYFHFFSYKDDQEYVYFLKLPPSLPTMQKLLNHIADFAGLQNLSLVGLRTSLLVSSIFPVSFDSKTRFDIVLIDDNYDEHGRCLTDGSGFISVDLAKKLPNYVLSGISKSTPNSDSSSISVSSWYQIRLLCDLGIFKGTVMVLPDLEGEVLVVRKSMQKVKARQSVHAVASGYIAIPSSCTWSIIKSINYCHASNNVLVLGVVNAGCRDIPAQSNMISFGRLNAIVLQLLHECGVTLEVLRNKILDPHIVTLLECVSDTVAIENFLGLYTSSDVELSTPANLLKRLLNSNVSMKETFVSVALEKLRQRELQYLLDLRIPCQPMTFLIGLPDPYGILGKEEVFIPDSHYLEKRDVIIFRYPIIRSANFGRRKAVTCEKLQSLFESKVNHASISSGIIFISSLLHADYGDIGGDFDGDRFVVIADERIVDAVTPKRDNSGYSNTGSVHFFDTNELSNNDDEIPLIQPKLDIENETSCDCNILSLKINDCPFEELLLDDEIRYTSMEELHSLGRILLWEYLFTKKNSSLGKLWNTWLHLLESTPSNSPLCLAIAQLQQEILSSRKLSMVSRTQLHDRIEKFLKRAKDRTLSYTLSHVGKLPLKSSFVLDLLNYIRENTDLQSTTLDRTINLDPAMKLEGADLYLSKAQAIFARYIDNIRALKREKRKTQLSNDLFHAYSDESEGFFQRQLDLELKTKMEIEHEVSILATELDKLQFTSAIYEASYLHAYNYWHRFITNVIPTNFNDEIYHSLSFVWKFLPKEGLLLYHNRSFPGMNELPKFNSESSSFKLSVDPS